MHTVFQKKTINSYNQKFCHLNLNNKYIDLYCQDN